MAKSGDGDAGGRVYLAGQGLSGPAARPQRLARDYRRATRGPKPGERAGKTHARGGAVSFLHAITPSADVGRP